jgi:hypothetical protein
VGGRSGMGDLGVGRSEFVYCWMRERSLWRYGVLKRSWRFGKYMNNLYPARFRVEVYK